MMHCSLLENISKDVLFHFKVVVWVWVRWGAVGRTVLHWGTLTWWWNPRSRRNSKGGQLHLRTPLSASHNLNFSGAERHQKRPSYTTHLLKKLWKCKYSIINKCFLFQTSQSWNFHDTPGCKGCFTGAGQNMVFGFVHAVSAIHTEWRMQLQKLKCDLKSPDGSAVSKTCMSAPLTELFTMLFPITAISYFLLKQEDMRYHSKSF